MGSCSAYGCKNRTNGRKTSGLTFHKFPLNALQRRKWIKCVKRKNWVPTKHSLLCSKHFTEDMFDRTSRCVVRLKPEAVPSLFDFPSSLQKNDKTSQKQQTKASDREMNTEAEYCEENTDFCSSESFIKETPNSPFEANILNISSDDSYCVGESSNKQYGEKLFPESTVNTEYKHRGNEIVHVLPHSVESPNQDDSGSDDYDTDESDSSETIQEVIHEYLSMIRPEMSAEAISQNIQNVHSQLFSNLHLNSGYIQSNNPAPGTKTSIRILEKELKAVTRFRKQCERKVKVVLQNLTRNRNEIEKLKRTILIQKDLLSLNVMDD